MNIIVLDKKNKTEYNILHMIKENFEKTIWHRLLKVLFVFLFLIVVVFILSNGLESRPLGSTYYEVKCANGKIIQADLNPNFKLSGEWVNHGNIRCSSTQLTLEQRRNYLSQPVDLLDIGYTYSLKHHKAPTNETMQWILSGIIAFTLLTLFMWFIKRLFFYIAFGESMLRKPKKLFD